MHSNRFKKKFSADLLQCGVFRERQTISGLAGGYCTMPSRQRCIQLSRRVGCVIQIWNWHSIAHSQVSRPTGLSLHFYNMQWFEVAESLVGPTIQGVAESLELCTGTLPHSDVWVAIECTLNIHRSNVASISQLTDKFLNTFLSLSFSWPLITSTVFVLLCRWRVLR